MNMERNPGNSLKTDRQSGQSEGGHGDQHCYSHYGKPPANPQIARRQHVEEGIDTGVEIRLVGRVHALLHDYSGRLVEEDEGVVFEEDLEVQSSMYFTTHGPSQVSCSTA